MHIRLGKTVDQEGHMHQLGVVNPDKLCGAAWATLRWRAEEDNSLSELKEKKS